MNALNHFLGKWKSFVTVTQADEASISYETTNTFSYLSGDEFVEDRALGEDEQTGHIGIWYEEEGKYHSVYFISPGKQRIKFVYDWDPAKLQMEGKAPLPDGSTMKAIDTVIDKNHYRWEIIHTNAEGDILLNMIGEQSRVIP